MKNYNRLTADQIAVLEAQSCRCENRDEVFVHPDFDPKYVRNVNFSGQIRLGSFKKKFTLAGGIGNGGISRT